MVFDNEGFLSPDLAGWTAVTRSEFKDWFELIYDLNRDAMKILSTIEPSMANNQEFLVCGFYRRALQSFQGAVLLAERGMIADALTLVRSCAETAIVMGNIANDKMFDRRLIETHDEASLTYSNVLLADPDSREFFTQEQIHNLEQIVVEIKGKYRESGPRKVVWAQAAKDANMTALYDTVYRMTSGDAAHATVSAVDRHVEADSEGKNRRLTFRAETRDLKNALSASANSLMHAILAVIRIFPRKDLQQMLRSYMERWASLEENG